MGREILAALLADEGYAAVHVLARRPLGLKHPRLHVHVVDFAALPRLPRIDDVFIALGTTIKVAGSQAAFRAVDFDAVVAVVGAARASGATKLGVVSAMGADAASPVFYSRVKGEMEQRVRAAGFDTTVIARPSMLAGDRASLKQAPRLGETLGLAAMQLLRPLIPTGLRAVQARDVALALIAAVCRSGPGVHVLTSAELQRGARAGASHG